MQCTGAAERCATIRQRVHPPRNLVQRRHVRKGDRDAVLLRATSLFAKQRMQFIALGETETISASCHFLKIGETGIVLDSGLDPEADGIDALPSFDIVHKHPDLYVDHVVVTHAHHDHIGSLPVLIQHFPHAKVHMTRATRDLADFVLPASARLQKRRMREGSAVHEPLFSEEEVDVYGYLYLVHEYNREFDVSGLKQPSPIRAELYNAGHILGSAGVLLTFEENGKERRVFYSSDTSSRSQTIIPGADYPESPIDVLIMESTLGADSDTELTTRRQEEERFAQTIKTVIERGGSILVPVFALGRAQETLALIDRYKQRGVIPEETPIFTAGGLRAVADVYDKLRFSTPRLNDEFMVFGVEQKRLPRSAAALTNSLAQPGIYVVSSGMLFERTVSNKIAQEIVEDEKSAILLVGFAREDSPADRILKAAETGAGTEAVIDDYRGPQKVNAHVERFRLSSHSHRRDLIQLVETLKPKKVVLVHGDADARTWLADNLRFFYPDLEIHVPQRAEVLNL
jgi:cleavage and polyadenylation specificity factor subunit 3